MTATTEIHPSARLALIAAVEMLRVYFELSDDYLYDDDPIICKASHVLVQTDSMESMRIVETQGPEGIVREREEVPDEYDHLVPLKDFRRITATVTIPASSVEGIDEESVWELAMEMAAEITKELTACRQKTLEQPDGDYAHVFLGGRTPHLLDCYGNPYRFDLAGNLFVYTYTLEAILLPRKANP